MSQVNIPTNQSNRPEPIYSLYVLKCLMAFLVVTCHTPFFATGDLLPPIARGAVPVFFLISGYFLYAPSLETSYRRAVKSLKNAAKIYLVVSLIYWAWLLPNNGNLMNSWYRFFVWLTMGAGFSGHLWYLVAMVEALAILALLFRFGRSWMLWLLIPLFLLALIGSQYSFLYTDERSPYVLGIYAVHNVFSHGLPCMAGGYLIAKHEPVLMRFRYWGYALIAGIGLLYGERALLEGAGYDYAMGVYFGSFLCAVLFFLTALQYKPLGQGSVMSKIGERYSGNIYYFHIIVATVLAQGFSLLGLREVYRSFGSVFVFFASWALAWVIVRLQERLGIRILR